MKGRLLATAIALMPMPEISLAFSHSGKNLRAKQSSSETQIIIEAPRADQRVLSSGSAVNSTNFGDKGWCFGGSDFYMGDDYTTAEQCWDG
jgi:hypothetical protein